VSACDPLNLAGIVLPGPRVPAVPTNFLILKDGVVVRTVIGRHADGVLFSMECIGAQAVRPFP
jgi:ATP-dependent helicase Lhr and Lhr-like helicase